MPSSLLYIMFFALYSSFILAIFLWLLDELDNNNNYKKFDPMIVLLVKHPSPSTRRQAKRRSAHTLIGVFR